MAGILDNFSARYAALSGGAQGSGKVGYADYLENMHSHLMYGFPASSYSTEITDDASKNVLAYLNIALTATNPYLSSGTVGSTDVVYRTAYTSTVDIGSAIDRYNTFDAIVSAIDPATDWASYLTTVNTNVGAIVYTQTDIDDAVASYEAQAGPTFFRGLNRFTAGMADINAVMTGAFVIGMANLERQFNQDVNSFRANLNLQVKKEKHLMVMQGMSDLMKLVAMQLAAQEASEKAYFDLMRARAAAGSEIEGKELDYTTRAISWYMEQFPYATNVLSSIAGAAVVPRPVSPISAFASGFLTTGASLAMMGAQVGGPEGALIGFGIGGILGGVGGFLANAY